MLIHVPIQTINVENKNVKYFLSLYAIHLSEYMLSWFVLGQYFVSVPPKIHDLGTPDLAGIKSMM